MDNDEYNPVYQEIDIVRQRADALCSLAEIAAVVADKAIKRRLIMAMDLVLASFPTGNEVPTGTVLSLV